MASLEQWACHEMEMLGIPDPGDIVRYLQPIDDPSEVEGYLTAMLDVNLTSHRKFIEEFLKKQEILKNAVDSRFYRKPDLENTFKVVDKKKQKGVKENGTNIGKALVNDKLQDDKQSMQSNDSLVPPKQSTSKKKNKYVALYSSEGKNKDVVILSGRHKCDCQASKHKLINNCIKCGRIVCEQEGSGPCSFCGMLVMTNEEEQLFEQGSRKSEALQKKLLSEKNSVVQDLKSSSDALKKAIEHKNKLLEFDQTSEKRTKVYDDENDYFSTNSRWLTQEQKAKLEKREEELRKKKYDRSNQKVTIDLLGRKVVMDENNDGLFDPEDPFIKEILESSNKNVCTTQNDDYAPRFQISQPEYVETDSSARKPISSKFMGIGMRVQDREMQEMVDEGLCLSMHQPWASLLIAGIKVHEGRTWYSSHRGRLWIGSAAKIPTQQEIAQLEQQCRVHQNNDNIQFPMYYPPGCLLGCVNVVDVLPQEEYRVKYPDGDSDSPYVFICEDPQEMVLKFPMKGQHKIYKMDPKIHQAAKKALRRREE